MSSLKQAYDALQPQKRVDFAGFRFVDTVPDSAFRVPKFRCCNGAHSGESSGSENEEDTRAACSTCHASTDVPDAEDRVVAATSTSLHDVQLEIPPNERFDMHGQFKSYVVNDASYFDDEVRLLGRNTSLRMHQTLKKVFGMRCFQHVQKQVITAALLGNDCFVLMPTGAGKSLCYQLPAVVSTGLTVVISPLRSLMVDQMRKLLGWKIDCECLKGGTDDFECDRICGGSRCQPKPFTMKYSNKTYNARAIS